MSDSDLATGNMPDEQGIMLESMADTIASQEVLDSVRPSTLVCTQFLIFLAGSGVSHAFRHATWGGFLGRFNAYGS